MRLLAFSTIFIVATCCHAKAAPFTPDPNYVCSDVPSPGNTTPLNKRLLVSFILEKQVGLTSRDLDQSGDDLTYDRKVSAILDPENFCTSLSRCTAKTKEKISETRILLRDFLTRSNIAKENEISIVIADRSGNPISMERYLRGGGDVTALCVNKKPKTSPDSASSSSSQNAFAGKAPSVGPAPQHFALRKSPSDLSVRRDSNKFEDIERASLGLSNDYENSKFSFNIDGVVGYAFDRYAYTDTYEFEGAVYFSYKQQYTDSSPRNSNIFNIGGGALYSSVFKFLDTYHEVQFYPQFIYSISTESKILSGNLEYNIPPFLDCVFVRCWHGEYGFRVSPKIKMAFSSILSAGTDPELQDIDNYFRIGPSIGASLVADKFQFNIMYEYYIATRNASNFSRFETSIEYILGERKDVSMMLKYALGKDLDTLQNENFLSLGIGLKY